MNRFFLLIFLFCAAPLCAQFSASEEESAKVDIPVGREVVEIRNRDDGRGFSRQVGVVKSFNRNGLELETADGTTTIAAHLVARIYYQKSMVNLINQNVKRIGFALMIASAALLFIAIALIRYTLRLSIYSKRFLVRSMLLVGATASYIRRPFIKSGITQGFFGALIADAMLALLLYGLMKRLPELALVQDYRIIIGIFVGIIVLGILLGGLSTRSALGRYLRADVDQLYA